MASGSGSVRLAGITQDGRLLTPSLLLANVAGAEAFTLAPVPLVAYKRAADDALTYIGAFVPPRRRAEGQ